MFFGQYKRVEILNVKPAPWSTTKHSKRQVEALEESLVVFGQIQPLLVRQIAWQGSNGKSFYYETIDGSSRIVLMKAIGRIEVDVLDLDMIPDDLAYKAHLILNLNRGVPAAQMLANILETIVSRPTDTTERAKEEVNLISTLPLVKRSIYKTIDKLRTGKKKPSAGNGQNSQPSQPSFIDFKFKVDPGAARVCDDALNQVEASTGCKRSTAFERICADYLAGPGVGG